MFHWSPLVDTLVDGGTVRPELCAGFNFTEEEVSHMVTLHGRYEDDFV